MSQITDTPKINSGNKKNKKNKRPATSPLSTEGTDNTGIPIDATHSVDSVKKYKQTSGQYGQYGVQNGQYGQFVSTNPNLYQTMAQFPAPPYGMQAYMTSPPQTPVYNMQPSPPPPWATEILDEMKQIKQKLQTIEDIKKTVNVISAKVSDLDTKFKSLEVRVIETEKASEFVARELDTNKNDLKRANDDIKKVKKACETIVEESKTVTKQNNEIDARVTELETRSMRENLMFYGIPEGGDDENCNELVHDVIINNLEMTEAAVSPILIDRVHRVGLKDPKKTRPIVAKFHYPQDKEKVRNASFEKANVLKKAKLGIGAQLPRAIREARKPCYVAMKKAKESGKNVKFVGAKLFINGEEYCPGATSTP